MNKENITFFYDPFSLMRLINHLILKRKSKVLKFIPINKTIIIIEIPGEILCGRIGSSFLIRVK